MGRHISPDACTHASNVMQFTLLKFASHMSGVDFGKLYRLVRQVRTLSLPAEMPLSSILIIRLGSMLCS